MNTEDENENLQPDLTLLPDRDIFGLEKPVIPVGDVVLEEPPELGVKYASLGSRFLAYILDIAICYIPIYFVELAFLGDGYEVPDSGYQKIMIDFTFWLLYFCGMESSVLQGTLGKRICNMKVIDESGGRMSFQQAAARHLAKFLSYIPFGLGFLAILTHRKHQAWHDSIAGCYVVIVKEQDEDEPEAEQENSEEIAPTV
jgi:uncharacterized RDD family membrane protein YckC